MNGGRIKLARKRAGLSLRALADRMDGKVSAQAIGKYERGEMTPSSDVLLALVKALDVSLPYLMSPQSVELRDVEFRTKSSTTARDRAKVETAVLETVERYFQIEQILELDSAEWLCPRPMPRMIRSADEAEALADELRDAWDLGVDPIPNMTELLEEKGIKVLMLELPERVSGFTCLVERPERDRVPVVVVNASFNLERRRFTLAHELAHRVIRAREQDQGQVERWCNRFAGAFLVPKEHLQAEAGGRRQAVGYREILDLKKLYGVAASALLVRLEQVRIIHNSALQYAFRTFAKGWRTSEPEAIEEEHEASLEKPKRFERLVYRALSEDMISAPKAAELLRVPVAQVELGLKGPADAHHR